jgi:hypothetical protein
MGVQARRGRFGLLARSRRCLTFTFSSLMQSLRNPYASYQGKREQLSSMISQVVTEEQPKSSPQSSGNSTALEQRRGFALLLVLIFHGFFFTNQVNGVGRVGVNLFSLFQAYWFFAPWAVPPERATESGRFPFGRGDSSAFSRPYLSQRDRHIRRLCRSP